ncbi:hypothetical protein P3T76_008553 [Phytophthora citrophthora]|uniref:HTH CENPB-type domain-containing protein n=1 Tax=Phytophthora citrophthora TaxID=4793 RepID=A0AAD9GIN6_9STRA|nr:hypothetical protein P3T76_008553 [Phytophthora citrophthora]
MAKTGALTFGGSGRKALTIEHEDIILTQIKDLRRQRYLVSRAMIFFMAQKQTPSLFEKKTVDAAMCWCARFMKRNRLSICRVTTRGRASREFMYQDKAVFCDEVRRVVAECVAPLNPSIDPRK